MVFTFTLEGFPRKKSLLLFLFYFDLGNYPGFVEFYSHSKTNFFFPNSFVVNFEPLKFMGYEFSSWRFGENGFLFLGDLDFVLSIVLGQFGLNY